MKIARSAFELDDAIRSPGHEEAGAPAGEAIGAGAGFLADDLRIPARRRS